MSKLETNTIDTVSGTSTLQVGSTNTSTITLGVSGDTINVPSGVTINNNGTQTGFGGTNTPAFEAFLSSDTSQLSNDTDTKIVFDTEIQDTNSTYDVSNGRFTPAVAGTYLIYGSIIFDDSNADLNAEHIVKIFKNGSQDSVFFHLPNMKDSIITYNITYVLDDNDYIEIFGKINNSDGARIINGAAANQKGTTFGAFKLIT